MRKNIHSYVPPVYTMMLREKEPDIAKTRDHSSEGMPSRLRRVRETSARTIWTIIPSLLVHVHIDGVCLHDGSHPHHTYKGVSASPLESCCSESLLASDFISKSPSGVRVPPRDAVNPAFARAQVPHIHIVLTVRRSTPVMYTHCRALSWLSRCRMYLSACLH